MSVQSVRLFDDPACTYPLRPVLPAHPRAADAIHADVAAALADGAQWIQLDGPEPTRHPDLATLVAAIREAGARVRLVTADADRLGLVGIETLLDAGVEQLDLWLLGGSAATHDPCLGRDGAFDRFVALLPDLSRTANLYTQVRIVLRRQNVGELVATVEQLATYFHRVDLCRLSVITHDRDVLRADGLPRRTALAALHAAWTLCARFRLPLDVEGFGTWPDPPVPTDDIPPPADRNLHALLFEDVVLPGLGNGVTLAPGPAGDALLRDLVTWLGSDVQELGLQLAAYGLPARDLPLAAGGLDLPVPDDRDPGAIEDLVEAVRTDLPAHRPLPEGVRATVIGGPISDGLLATSTFAALARALAAEGVPTDLQSPYERPFNPHADPEPLPDLPLVPQPDGRVAYAPDDIVRAAPTSERMAYAEVHRDAFLDGLDLKGRGLIVCPDWKVALRVWHHPDRDPGARVVVTDLHMLSADPAAFSEGGGWPSDDLVVHSTFPRYVRSYWFAGVPQRQIQWRPYPIHRGHFGLGPDPRACTDVFAGGKHGRDWDVLARAVSTLDPSVRDRVVIHTSDDVPAPLTSRGMARLLAFHEAIANSRFVVVPLKARPWTPAGISVFSMALAAGRPVIATSTRAAHDHLRHGVDSLLVPAHDPRALAAAIDRLLRDDALLAHLAAGARDAGAAAGADRWARDLVHGLGPRRVFPIRGVDGQGPYVAWAR